MTTWTTLDVDYHQFSLVASPLEPGPSVSVGELFDASDNCILVHTGVATGPVRIGVERLEQAPPVAIDSSWENSAEVSIVVGAELTFLTALGDSTDDVITLPPPASGFLGIRVSARGRGSHWDQDVHEPTEDYLFQVWPDSAERRLRLLKSTDGMWTDDGVWITATDSEDATSAPPRTVVDPFGDKTTDATVRRRGPVSWDPEQA